MLTLTSFISFFFLSSRCIFLPQNLESLPFDLNSIGNKKLDSKGKAVRIDTIKNRTNWNCMKASDRDVVSNVLLIFSYVPEMIIFNIKKQQKQQHLLNFQRDCVKKVICGGEKANNISLPVRLRFLFYSNVTNLLLISPHVFTRCQGNELPLWTRSAEGEQLAANSRPYVYTLYSERYEKK